MMPATPSPSRSRTSPAPSRSRRPRRPRQHPRQPPVPTPGAVRGVRLTPGDGRIEVAWIAPADDAGADRRLPDPLPLGRGRVDGIGRGRVARDVGRRRRTHERRDVRVRGGGRRRDIGGLVDGRAHDRHARRAPGGAREAGRRGPGPRGADPGAGRRRVARVRLSVRMLGRPGPYLALPNRCRLASGITTAEIGNLTNGVEYVCRAFAANAAGLSDPSEASDAVRPCGSLLECNPVAPPILGLLGFLVARRAPRDALRPVPGSNSRVRGRRRRRRPHRESRPRIEAGDRLRPRPARRTGHRDRRRSESERGRPHSASARGDRFEVTDRVGRSRRDVRGAWSSRRFPRRPP